MKGYKGFDKDLKCRDFQYEIGKTYKHDGEIEVCLKGFHFCKKMSNIHNYYNLNDEETRVCEITATGNIKEEEDKCVTDEITILRELSKEEIELLKNEGVGNIGVGNTGNRNTGNRNAGDRNTGDWNTGNFNAGDCNAGDCNAGDWNIGNFNTGDRNTGDWNTGDWNIGNFNAGDCNAGDWNIGNFNTGNRNTGNRNTGDWNIGNFNAGDCNAGDRNTGDWNTGDWNTTNYSTGCFCTKEEKINFFDKKTDLTYEDWKKSKACDLLYDIRKNIWINFEDMTDEEKEKYPNAKTCDGYLKELDLKEEAERWWNNLTDNEKEVIRAIPNYNVKKFRKIMGGAEIG